MNIIGFNIYEVILIASGTLLFLVFIYASVISFLEKEKEASSRFIVFGIISAIPFYLIAIIDIKYEEIYIGALLSVLIILLLIFILPIRLRSKYKNSIPVNRIDERDTMFSRNELKNDPVISKEYYSKNPDKLSRDEKILENPGLMDPKSSNYDPILFGSAHASFYTIGTLKSKVDGKVEEERKQYDEQQLTRYIKKWTKKLGALDVGITRLQDYHNYSYRGRGNYYNDKVEAKHKFAIAFTVEMDYNMVKSGPYGQIVMESAQQYLSSGVIAVQVAEFIRHLGYPARAHIDGNYEVVCPLVAKDAGLGEIGRMGLLMTPGYGPRVRIAVVTTDLPLITDTPEYDPSVIEFCTNCKKCAVNCPSKSISIVDRELIDGVNRWQINQESCFDLWTKLGTDCGRCLSVCPYSHPNNFLHNIIRFGIRNSSLFSRLALLLDDVIYGKKPKVAKPADWMNVKEK
jgi:reductive dehalogenase